MERQKELDEIQRKFEQEIKQKELEAKQKLE